MNNVLGRYVNGNYTVTIYDDGTKIRENDLDNLTPEFAENCDVKITDKCDGGCAFCYENCTPDGEHANLSKYNFLHNLHPFTELALNGNDLSHPQLLYFLKMLKEQDVIANMTVNQKHFMYYYNYIKSLIDNNLIKGLGISLRNIREENFIERVKTIPNAVIHTIVGITTLEEYDFLAQNKCKILILGYKMRGRGIEFSRKCSKTISDNIIKLHHHLPALLDIANLVSFDNLAINQLSIKNMLTEEQWQNFYMGDDGQYTFYLDLVNGTFSRNSVSNIKYEIGDKNIDEMFKIIQEECKPFTHYDAKGTLTKNYNSIDLEKLEWFKSK